MLHHVHENALLLLITCDVCMCVCYLYCGYKNPCIVTLWIFLTHIWTQWQNLVSWVCKANVAHRLTLMKNDTIRSLYSRCTIKHSCKGEALDKCMSVSPLRGCRMRAMTLQYNLRLSAEEPMKKLLLCCSFFFFLLHGELCLCWPDKNVCVCLKHRLSSRCTCLLQSYGMQRLPVQSKVEGEHPKDTTLAAVLISWLTAQVI